MLNFFQLFPVILFGQWCTNFLLEGAPGFGSSTINPYVSLSTLYSLILVILPTHKVTSE